MGSIALTPFLVGMTPVTLEARLFGVAESSIIVTLNVVRLAPPLNVTARFNGWEYETFVQDEDAQDALRSDLADAYDLQVEQVEFQDFSRGSVIAKYTVAPLVNLTRSWNASRAEAEAQDALAETMAQELAQAVAARVVHVGANLYVTLPGYRATQQRLEGWEWEAPPSRVTGGGQPEVACPPCPPHLVLVVEMPLEEGGYRCSCILAESPGDSSQTGLITAIVIPVVGGVIAIAVIAAVAYVMIQRQHETAVTQANSMHHAAVSHAPKSHPTATALASQHVTVRSSPRSSFDDVHGAHIGTHLL
eukprot:jgi/Mesvir1/20527/Mv25341-RA.1